ncbi:MAG: hypothetical protein ACJ76M_17800 [Solirubrobacteraceae bacterium]
MLGTQEDPETALSGDFMINASGQGVYVAPLFEQWRRDAFAWGRRVVP